VPGQAHQVGWSPPCQCCNTGTICNYAKPGVFLSIMVGVYRHPPGDTVYQAVTDFIRSKQIPSCIEKFNGGIVFPDIHIDIIIIQKVNGQVNSKVSFCDQELTDKIPESFRSNK
jgi:hypothetical protein